MILPADVSGDPSPPGHCDGGGAGGKRAECSCGDKGGCASPHQMANYDMNVSLPPPPESGMCPHHAPPAEKFSCPQDDVAVCDCSTPPTDWCDCSTPPPTD